MKFSICLVVVVTTLAVECTYFGNHQGFQQQHQQNNQVSNHGASRYGEQGQRCNGQDDGCCTAMSPCKKGEGDCDFDDQCAGTLVCGNDNCPWGDGDDCCTHPSPYQARFTGNKGNKGHKGHKGNKGQQRHQQQRPQQQQQRPKQQHQQQQRPQQQHQQQQRPQQQKQQQRPQQQQQKQQQRPQQQNQQQQRPQQQQQQQRPQQQKQQQRPQQQKQQQQQPPQQKQQQQRPPQQKQQQQRPPQQKQQQRPQQQKQQQRPQQQKQQQRPQQQKQQQRPKQQKQQRRPQQQQRQQQRPQQQQQQGQGNCKVDLGFLLDASGSIQRSFEKEKEFIKRVVAHFKVSQQNNRVGVVTFSNIAELSIKLKDHNDAKSFNDALDKIKHIGSYTRIALALRTAERQMFTQTNGTRNGVTKVLIVITDGTQTFRSDFEKPDEVADELRQKGLNIHAVGVGRGIDEDELKKIAGRDGSVYVAENFNELLKVEFIKKVQKKACEAGNNQQQQQQQQRPQQKQQQQQQRPQQKQQQQQRPQQKQQQQQQRPQQKQQQQQQRPQQKQQQQRPQQKQQQYRPQQQKW